MTTLTTTTGTRITAKVMDSNRIEFRTGSIIIRNKAKNIRSDGGLYSLGRTGGQLVKAKFEGEEAEKLDAIIKEVKKQGYELLIKQANKVIFLGGDNETKALELIAEAKKVARHTYRGEESEGMNLSIDAQYSKLEAQAQSLCPHTQATKALMLGADNYGNKEITVFFDCATCGATHEVKIN